MLAISVKFVLLSAVNFHIFCTPYIGIVARRGIVCQTFLLFDDFIIMIISRIYKFVYRSNLSACQACCYH